jgi:MerR family transcriptional regulator, heat shock protein HspR
VGSPLGRVAPEAVQHLGPTEPAGLHSQALWLYKRKGLLDPARSPGGTGRCSRNDTGRLQEICGLAGTGLNMVGIRQVLAPAA